MSLTCPQTGNRCVGINCPGHVDSMICHHLAALASIQGVPGRVLYPAPAMPRWRPADDIDPGPGSRVAGLARELVVARYKEDVSWVALSPIPVTIYNKGPDDLDLPSGIEVVKLANRGREGRTWLSHFLRCRDTLADLTFVTQGDPHQSPNEFLARLSLDYDDTASLTSRYMPAFPPQWIKDRDEVADRDGSAIRYGRAIYQGGRPQEDNESWLRRIWPYFFACPIPEPIGDWTYGYGAMYAIPYHRILDRSADFWSWCRDVIARPEHQAERTWGSGYAFELIWRFLLGDAGRYPVRDRPDPAVADLTVDACRFETTGRCGCDGSFRSCTQPIQPSQVRRALNCLDCPFAELPLTSRN